MKKKLACLLLGLLVCVVLVTPALAAQTNGLTIYVDGTIYDEYGNVLPPNEPEPPIISPYDATKYYVKNKRATTTSRVLSKYFSSSWSYAREYTVSKNLSHTFGIEVTGTAEFKSGIKLSGAFTNSKTKTVGLATTIRADDKRLSKLGLYEEYQHYTCDLYKMIYNQSEVISDVKTGSGTVKEPKDTYILVVYK